MKTGVESTVRIAALGALVVVLALVMGLGLPQPVLAADLTVSSVQLAPCPSSDAASQSGLKRPTGTGCWALSGEVFNNSGRSVVDTDVFALVVDASGEPVLQNRSRVGSIGDIPPGRSTFALRLAVPMGTPGPLQVRNVRARGFSAPVRSRAGAGDELLPLEQQLDLG